MKKYIFTTFVAIAAMCGGAQKAEAQFLKNLFNNSTVKDVVAGVTDKHLPLSKSQLVGTWSYQASACRFESDDLLEQAGGAAMSSQVNKQLSQAYAKIGITSNKLNFTFTDGDTFSSTIAGKNISGSYTLNSDTKEIVLTYKALSQLKVLSIKGSVSKVGDTLFLYFNVDKLLSLLSSVANATQIKSLQTVGALASKYDGLMLGFELKQNKLL